MAKYRKHTSVRTFPRRLWPCHPNRSCNRCLCGGQMPLFSAIGTCSPWHRGALRLQHPESGPELDSAIVPGLTADFWAALPRLLRLYLQQFAKEYKASMCKRHLLQPPAWPLAGPVPCAPGSKRAGPTFPRKNQPNTLPASAAGSCAHFTLPERPRGCTPRRSPPLRNHVQLPGV